MTRETRRERRDLPLRVDRRLRVLRRDRRVDFEDDFLPLRFFAQYLRSAAGWRRLPPFLLRRFLLFAIVFLRFLVFLKMLSKLASHAGEFG